MDGWVDVGCDVAMLDEKTVDLFRAMHATGEGSRADNICISREKIYISYHLGGSNNLRVVCSRSSGIHDNAVQVTYYSIHVLIESNRSESSYQVKQVQIPGT